MAKFNLLDLYKQAFGSYVALSAFKASTELKVPEPVKKDAIATYDFTPQETSLLGTPIFLPCTIENVRLQNEPIISLGFSKTLIKTPIDSNDGTFKELFAMNDWAISIRGIIVNEEEDDLPEDDLRKLRGLIERKTHLKVTNRLLNLFGINYLAIENGSVPAEVGAQSWQPYEFNCLSDKVFDLELKKK